MHPRIQQRRTQVREAAEDDLAMLRHIEEIQIVLAQTAPDEVAPDVIARFLDYCADARQLIATSSATTPHGAYARQKIAAGFEKMGDALETALKGAQIWIVRPQEKRESCAVRRTPL